MDFMTWYDRIGKDKFAGGNYGKPILDYFGWVLYQIEREFRFDNPIKDIFTSVVTQMTPLVPLPVDRRHLPTALRKLNFPSGQMRERIESSLRKNPIGSPLGVPGGATAVTGACFNGHAIWQQSSTQNDPVAAQGASVATENLRKASKPWFTTWGNLLNNKHAEDIWMRLHFETLRARVNDIGVQWAHPSTRSLYSLQTDPHRVEFRITDAPCAMMCQANPWPPVAPNYTTDVTYIPPGTVARQGGCRNYFMAMRALLSKPNMPILVYWANTYDGLKANYLFSVDENGQMCLSDGPWAGRAVIAVNNMIPPNADATFRAKLGDQKLMVSQEIRTSYQHYKANPTLA
ncbi:MAG: hypothetical protein ACLQVG_05130 [Terriglobia bacterium]